MKKIAKSLIIVFALMNLALTIQMASAGPLDDIKAIGEGTGMKSFTTEGQHPDAPPDYVAKGVGAATSPILFAIDLFRLAISGIAVLVVIIASVNLVSTASDDEAGKAKETILMGIIGLLVVQLANVAVKKMFFGEYGEAFEDVATVQIYAKETVNQVRGIIGFVEAFVGASAVFVFVIRGFMLITSAGEEEEMTKTKRHLLYAVVGLAAVAISEVVVRGVVFPADGQALPDTEKARYVIVRLTNYMAGFVSTLSFATLFYAGYQYVTSAGDEESTENVKKIFTGAIIALLLSLGAFALVNTFLKFDPGKPEAVQEQVEIDVNSNLP